jgi:ribosome-binding protein aMBF1 (putative translation factor)
MSTALGLAMQISANTAQLATAVQDVNKRLDDMAGSGKKAAKDLAVLKTIEISRVLIDGITAVAGAFVTASQSARRLFDDSRAQIDALGKLSQQTQVSVEAIQAYSLAAAQAGLSSEEFAKSLQRLTISVGKADDEKDTNPFAKLGLSVEQLKSLKPEEIFESVAEALSQIANDQERAAIATEIFGRGGVKLLPLINGGADALARAREEAEGLGGILTQEEVRNVEAMNDAFTKVGAAVQAVINKVVVNLSPVIKEIADNFTAFIAQANSANLGAEIADRLLSFVEVFAETFRGVAKFLGNFLEQLRQLVNNIPGINLETDADKERQRLEDRATTDTQLRKELAELQKTIARNNDIIKTRATDTRFNLRVNQAGFDNERLQALEEAKKLDIAVRGLSEANARRLQELRNGANAVSDTIDSAVDSVVERVRQARERIAQQRDDLAQPRVEEAQAQVDGVAQSVEESNQEVVEATEENTAEIRGLRSDIRNGQAQVVEIPG